MVVGKVNKKYDEIVLLRVIGVVMILMCHFTQKEHVAALGELFITGVPLFLFISGFCVGLKPIKSGWLRRRAVRILIPFYFFVIPALIVLWLSDHSLVSQSQFIFLITNLQGLNYFYWKSTLYSAVLGLGQLWFTTEIMLCYIISPELEKITDKTNNKKIMLVIVAVIILVIQPIIINYGIQISYIVTFFLGYLTARYKVNITNKRMLLLTLGCSIITIVRFGLMSVVDGTNFYDRYYALVSAAAIGIWIFFFIFWISSKSKLIENIARNKIIVFLANISFEIYIVHFWFLNGKWQVSNYINNMLLADCMVLLCSVITAYILHLIAKPAIQYFNNRSIEL